MASRKRTKSPLRRLDQQQLRRASFRPRVVLRTTPEGKLKIDTNMADTPEAWQMVWRMLSVAGASVVERLGADVQRPQIEVPQNRLLGPDGKPIH